jgi:hypothetical protein
MADVTKRAVFKNDQGGISVVVPSPGLDLSMLEVAQRVVPAGQPFWIINVTDQPNDRTFRNAWEIDEAEMGNPSGYGQGG